MKAIIEKHSNEDLLTSKNLNPNPLIVSEAFELQQKREMVKKTDWRKLCKNS